MEYAEMYAGKNILVTGGDGFIGSHLTEKLIDLGAKVSVLVRGTSRVNSTASEFKNINPVRDKLSSILAYDISSEDVIPAIVDLAPDIIFHLAAIAYVNYSFDHPKEVHAVNTVGTLNVLESTRQLKNVKTIITSSSEVYGTAQYIPIDEKHSLNPTSPYAASKAAADRYCFSYIHTYNLPICVIRPFNTFGPRHTYDVIPKFIRLALENQPLTIYGTGAQKRDFLYVDDNVNAFLTMGSHPDAVHQFVNFGTNSSISILDLAKMIINLSDSKSEIKFVEQRQAEVNHLICDNGKAKNLLGWSPKISLEEGIRRNIAWERIRHQK